MFTGSELFDDFVQPKVGGGSPQLPHYYVIRDSGHDGGDFVFSRTSAVVDTVARTPATSARAKVNKLNQWQEKIVPVIVNMPWTQTGIQLSPGQIVSISAEGDMNWYTAELNPPGCPPGMNCHVGPEGRECPWAATTSTKPGLRCLSLIGRIGTCMEFEVGKHNDFVSDCSGELLLGVNDTNWSDNTGQWIATIKWKSAP